MYGILVFSEGRLRPERWSRLVMQNGAIGVSTHQMGLTGLDGGVHFVRIFI